MIGKLSMSELEELVINNISSNRDDVVLHAAIGEDCAVIDLKDELLVITTDPITATTNAIGSLAIDINMNDIASMAAKPIGIMLTILMPVDSNIEVVSQIMKEANKRAKELGVQILGGHTEFTDAVNRVVVSAVAIGSMNPKKVLKKSNISAGDHIIMTKGVGIEGCGIIANNHKKNLEKILNENEINYAINLIGKTSVVKESEIASKNGVVAMHDVTEGGLFGAIWEILNIGSWGCKIYEKNIIISDVVKKICKFYGINPYKLISSGCMLIISPSENSEKMVEELSENSIEASVIGIVEKGEKIFIDNIGIQHIIDEPNSDEIYKIQVEL